MAKRKPGGKFQRKDIVDDPVFLRKPGGVKPFQLLIQFFCPYQIIFQGLRLKSSQADLIIPDPIVLGISQSIVKIQCIGAYFLIKNFINIFSNLVFSDPDRQLFARNIERPAVPSTAKIMRYFNFPPNNFFNRNPLNLRTSLQFMKKEKGYVYFLGKVCYDGEEDTGEI